MRELSLICKPESRGSLKQISSDRWSSLTIQPPLSKALAFFQQKSGGQTIYQLRISDGIKKPGKKLKPTFSTTTTSAALPGKEAEANRRQMSGEA